MQCISPMQIRNPTLEKNKKTFLVVPCSRCAFCLSLKRQDWAFRLYQEHKICHTAKFITLTYNDESLPFGYQDPTLDKKGQQRFLKRLRKINLNIAMKKKSFATRKQANEQTPKIRYYMVGEYGTQYERPHYHYIMFNMQTELFKDEKKLTEIWGNGHVHIDPVNALTINYTLKYLVNKDDYNYDGKQKPFSMMSTKPPLGINYISEQNKEYHIQKQSITVKNRNGTNQRLPRIYKEKIFSDYDLEDIGQKAYNLSIELNKVELERLSTLGHTHPTIYQAQQKEEQIKSILKQSKKSTL